MTANSRMIADCPVPGRVPDFPRRGIPPFLYGLIPPVLPIWLTEKVIGAPIRLDPALRNEMIEGLWEGDEPMDRVVEWMFAFGPRQAKKLFEQALEHGIESVADAPEALHEFFALIDRPPAWVDMSRVRKGARAANAYGSALPYLARDLTLMGGFLLSGLNEPLVMTGALTKGSGRRFAETLSWALDIYAPDGMERFGVGFKSTIRVRMIHALVRRNLQRKPEWDFERLGVPINQTDMLATILSTATAGLGGWPLGVPVTRTEADAVAYHGRYVGWLMGVKEEWAFDTAAEGMRLLLHSASTQPRGEETSRTMAQSLANEPLTRQYDHLQSLRRRIEYSKHLSISGLFLSRRMTDKLGIPKVLPWYPALTLPARLSWQTAHRLTPGGYRRLVEKGFRQQKKMLAALHASAGSKGGILKPDEAHPAHV